MDQLNKVSKFTRCFSNNAFKKKEDVVEHIINPAKVNFGILSIVVPTFNQGQYIADCLNSICNQSYENIEVIIQDSLSDDETESICTAAAIADSRVKYFREKDSGQSDAINRGLRRSSGAAWTWICSDDFYLNDHCLAD